jgi:hypothetical protein
MITPKWKNNTIWKLIKNKNTEVAKQVITFLENPKVMDKIEKILSKGCSSPKDFTLHDEDHSFRVAERMIEVIPELTINVLTEYDLMMMLLTAYLHDIGMTPEFKKIENHFSAITTENKSRLLTEELAELQKWLDNENVQIDISFSKITDLDKASELLTYYARYKHNDWSEEWILENLNDIELPSYKRWQTDLINICKSHHYGIEELSKDKFDPKIIGGTCCHRRYISVCLRIADVMEIDPERTPEVLFRHRNISQKSIPFWLKDQEITILIKNGNMSFSARPQKAYLHRAIEATIEQIEYELTLCNNLNAKKPFAYIGPNDTRNYHWQLALINKDLQPFEDSYVYIKGSFRPNVNRVLELLGGTELYGEKIVAVRELLQNSFDSVKERIAYRRLLNNLFEKDWEKKLGDEYLIKIKIETNNEGVWLIIKDQGVGMTKEIIENYFLVSGSSQRHQLSELSRKCSKAGFSFERTGQFGIGVLSYFMIANKVVIKTKRAQDCGYYDNDLVGWEFEIGGLQDFGELRRCHIEGAGTEIRLLMKMDIYKTCDDLEKVLREYISRVLVKVPCRIIIESSFSNEIELSSETGWFLKKEELENRLVKAYFNRNEYGAPSEKTFFNWLTNTQLALDKPQFDDSHVIEDFRKKIKWEIFEGELPGSLGSYRFFIPVFEFEGRISFYYFWEEKNEIDSNLKPFNLGIPIIDPNHQSGRNSWKGFQIDIYVIIDTEKKAVDKHLSIRHGVYCEIELNSSKFTIAVDRKKITIAENIYQNLDNFLTKTLIEIRTNLATREKSGRFLFSNLCYLNQFSKLHGIEDKYWFFDSRNTEMNFSLNFKKMAFPFLIWDSAYSYSKYLYKENLIYKSFFSELIDKPEFNNLIKYSSLRLCFIKQGETNEIKNVAILADGFVNRHTEKDVLDNEFTLAEFPLGWDSLVCVFVESKFVNAKIKHSAGLLYQPIHLKYDLFSKLDDSLEDFKKYYLSHEGYSLRLMLEMIFASRYRNDWKEVILKELEFFKVIWDDAFNAKEIVYFFEIDLKRLYKIENIAPFFSPLSEENLLVEKK